MRWSEFAAKECIDLVNGKRLGDFMHADLAFDPQTGKIQFILLPTHSSWLKRNQHSLELKWSMIRKVGPEMVIVDSADRKASKKQFE
ncbi:YlmC/YmxH family sporulation protein [Thermoactinomyces mirandus]|uniref:YlmC/YmxH family sporulation protein n=1 Tax=Thermoactinomyces mirandus TaxID=2756294 RepID=A0A7W1XRR5_9BACL|nr:YlmC/YmxH family sporulation protein [Thermoactinomyces mirandus]MBA4602098.1 YlmC/YmxH family sporulation protein [Thermoactinomyces mirandus]